MNLNRRRFLKMLAALPFVSLLPFVGKVGKAGVRPVKPEGFAYGGPVDPNFVSWEPDPVEHWQPHTHKIVFKRKRVFPISIDGKGVKCLNTK